MLTDWTNEKIIELLRQRLKEQRFIHSLNVADSAKELAIAYGADPEKCYTAGLLHDVMKNAEKSEHIKLFEAAKITLLPEEQNNKKLWHAMSGELYLKHEMKIADKQILNAVRYHTTGRAGMSLVEKVIFVADYISAERDYPDVEIMRRLSAIDLDLAMLYALKYTIEQLLKKGQTIHHDNINLYNELTLEMKGRNK